MNKKARKSVKNQHLLIGLCALLWISVIFLFFGFIHYRGGLRPEAAVPGSVPVMASIELVSGDGVAIKGGKITLSRDSVNHYFYADSEGKVDINLPEGTYKVIAQAPNFRNYDSVIDLKAAVNLAITLFPNTP